MYSWRLRVGVGLVCYVFFFFKQKTTYELRIGDWSSDVFSSDLVAQRVVDQQHEDTGLVTEPVDGIVAGLDVLDLQCGDMPGQLLHERARHRFAGRQQQPYRIRDGRGTRYRCESCARSPRDRKMVG